MHRHVRESMRTVTAAFRILADTTRYRLEKREMGNLVTSMSLAAALSLPILDIAHRLLFGAMLNVWVYLANDLFDVEIDMRAKERASERTRFLFENRRTGWMTCVLFGAAVLALGLAHGVGLGLTFVATAIVIVAYSAALKRHPIVDLLAMTAWGVSMGMVGFPLTSAVGWRFAGLLAILCTVTEAVQVIRDEASDREAGVRTTAVVLGVAATSWIARVLIVSAAAYACLLLHRFAGALLLLALPTPLGPSRITRSWDVLRVVFGVTWLALLALFFRAGRLDGALPTP
jgi:4-hydroxybenzoate polyprenyltransferase